MEKLKRKREGHRENEKFRPACGDWRVEATVGRSVCGGWYRKVNVWSGIEERATTGVGVRNGVAKKERQNVTRFRASHSVRADFPTSSTPTEGIDRQKSRVEPCMVKNQQGWAMRLVDVAGDVIKDWTPRRTNTFEKLSKVLNLKNEGYEKESGLT